jgi:hypothetical protein
LVRDARSSKLKMRLITRFFVIMLFFDRRCLRSSARNG